MRKINFICLLGVILILASSCGGSSGSPSGSTPIPISGLNITTSAIKATPQINGSIAAESSLSPQSMTGLMSLSSGTSNVVESFFKLECHDEENVLNFCPGSVTADLDSKFSMTTLIGLIQHSDMYLAGIYTSEEIIDPDSGESETISTYKTCGKGSTAELTDHTPVYSPSNANKFIVDFGSLFDCAGELEEWQGTTNYGTYSKGDADVAADDRIFAGMTTRKQVVGTEDYTGTMSDIFQTYLRRDDNGDPVIIGSNLVAFDDKDTDDSAMRGVLMANIQENRFAAKYISGTSSDNYHYVIAIGNAGFDPIAKDWIDGYYMVKAKFGSDDAETACIQNGSQAAEVDESNCSDFSGFFSEGGWTIGELHTWLGSSAADQTNLAGFDDFFSDDEFLATDNVPANNSDYFPDSISN